MPDDLGSIIPLLLPVIALQLVLIVIALRDLLRPDRRARGVDKRVWVLVIVFIQLVGPILYLTIGREDQ